MVKRWFIMFLLLFCATVCYGNKNSRRITDWREASFEGKQFKESVSFDYDTFDISPGFFYTHFYSDAHFNHTVFKSEVRFNRATFDLVTSFSDAQFQSETKFINVVFNDWAIFRGTDFNAPTMFENTVFNGNAYFYETSFDTNISFNFSTFNSKASFWRARFTDSVYFRKVNFGSDGLLDLSEVTFSNGEICHINLTGTDLSKVKLRYGNFRLLFDSTDNSNTRETVYLNLKARLNELCYAEDVEILDKEYQRWQYLEKDPDNIKRVRNFMQCYWWGYGYEKQYIIRNTMLIFLLYCVINLSLTRKLCTSIYRIDVVYNDIQIDNEKKISGFIRHVYHSIFYTGIIFFGFYFNVDKFQNSKGELYTLRKFPLVIYFFIMYVSGLVCLGYLVNYVLSV